MITPSMVYWMTRCDSVRKFFLHNDGMGILVALLLAAAFVAFLPAMFAGHGPYDLFSGSSDEEYEKKKKACLKISKVSFYLASLLIVLIFVFNVIGSFVPTTKEMCAIAVIPRIANSQSVQEIGQGIVDLAKDWLDELRPDKSDANCAHTEESEKADMSENCETIEKNDKNEKEVEK